MSQSSGFDPEASYAIQMCGAFRFLFSFSSAIFSFFLIGTVGTGLSLEQQLACALLPWCQQRQNGLARGEFWSVAPRGHCWHGDPPAVTHVRGAVRVWLVAGCWAGSGEVGLPVRTSLDGMFGELLAADATWFTATPLFSVDFGHTDVPFALSGTSAV